MNREDNSAGLGEVGDNLSMVADMMMLADMMEGTQLADDDMAVGDILLSLEHMKNKEVVEHNLSVDKKLLMEVLSTKELEAPVYPHMVAQMEHG